MKSVELKKRDVFTYSEQVSSLFEIFDSRQPVEHTLQSSTLGHDSCHFVNLLIILLLIWNQVRQKPAVMQYCNLTFITISRG